MSDTFKIRRIDKSNKQNANSSRTIRFPDDLLEEYTNLAKNTGHSFNSLVLSAMRYALEHLEIDDGLLKNK